MSGLELITGIYSIVNDTTNKEKILLEIGDIKNSKILFLWSLS